MSTSFPFLWASEKPKKPNLSTSHSQRPALSTIWVNIKHAFSVNAHNKFVTYACTIETQKLVPKAKITRVGKSNEKKKCKLSQGYGRTRRWSQKIEYNTRINNGWYYTHFMYIHTTPNSQIQRSVKRLVESQNTAHENVHSILCSTHWYMA